MKSKHRLPRGAGDAACNRDFLYVEPEQHHVAVLHHILFAFGTHQTLFFGGGHRSARHQVVVRNHFGPDEAALEVGMNFAGGLRRFRAARIL